MRHYTQLTLEQRYQMQALLKTGHRYREMAHIVGVHPSTLSREVRRNQGCRGYRPQQAHRRIPVDTLASRRAPAPGTVESGSDKWLVAHWPGARGES